MRRYGLSRQQKRARIPKLPNHPVKHDPADKGAPLPAPSDQRFEFVQVGRDANGWPITEARPKPWPTR